MKVNLYIPTHGRPRITKTCFQGVERIIETFDDLGVQVRPVVAVSDDANRDLCKSFGFEYHDIAPSPLGRRLNELNKCGPQDYDYRMELGSDDIMEDELCMILAAWMYAGAGIFGVSSIYIMNIYTGEVKRVDQKLVFGAGRCIRRDLVEQTGELYEDYIGVGNDGNSQTRVLRATGYGCKTVSTPRPLLWDIKSNHNLVPWSNFERYRTVTPDVKPPEL